MLPVAPFTETSGTFVNAQGLPQSFKGTVAPLGQTRPAWKVLRVLGNVLQLQGFEDETSESVRDTALAGGVESRLSNDIKAARGPGQAAPGPARLPAPPVHPHDATVPPPRAPLQSPHTPP